ncbi:hypothetical protein, partial [Anaeromyxobacter oryzisoli]|uniref:hypothetical protein n=1 Tax=Anaeromyxobacter oryzisoli TaxID=2925408 RepID=UPI001F563C30
MDVLSNGVGWTALAVGAVLGAYAAAYAGVRRLRRLPASIAAALALALLVCLEAAIANGLSLAGALTRGGVLAAHLLAIAAAGAGLAWR